MRINEVQQVRVINATTAGDYEEQFNAVMTELAAYHPSFVQDSTKPFLCFVYYKTEIKTAETVADEFALEGRDLRCGDCPYFFCPEDRRMSPKCLVHGYRTSDSRPCCEEYLKELKKHESGVRVG